MSEELTEREIEVRRMIGLVSSWRQKFDYSERKLKIAIEALETIKQPDILHLLVPAKQIASAALSRIRAMR